MAAKPPPNPKAPIVEIALFVACIHFFLNDKGGEGKSTLAHLLMEYISVLLKRPVTLVEGDRSQPDLKRLYEPLIGHSEYPTLAGVSHAFFSEDDRLRAMSDAMFNIAITSPGEIVWNSPANVSPALFRTFQEDDLITFANDNKIGLVNWCVTSGNRDSLQHFKRCLKEFPSIKHVLVRNYGLSDDFSHLEEDHDLRTIIKTHRVPVIDLPKIPYEEQKLLKAHNLTFSQGLSVLRETKGALAANRLSRFFKQACAQIKAAGVFLEP